jgi:hypothetical protein
MSDAESRARENAKDHDRYAVVDGDGGYEYARTRDVADFLQQRLADPARIVDLSRDGEQDRAEEQDDG